MALIWVDGDGPACRCDGCDMVIMNGRGRMVDGFELCEECLADELAKAKKGAA